MPSRGAVKRRKSTSSAALKEAGSVYTPVINVFEQAQQQADKTKNVINEL